VREDGRVSPPAPAARSASRAPDSVCAAAVELAHDAAVSEAGSAAWVGDALDVVAEPGAERVVTHRFACLLPAYSGWTWAVTLARAARSRVATVDEVVLLPGEDALLAPEWVPWSERLQPGDLTAGGLLPAAEDDERLVPAYASADPEPAAGIDPDLHWELGLGRTRVLSRDGRDDAVERWYAGEAGPGSEVARKAPGRCAECGFLVPVAGALRQVFGVCANELAPDDGRVVALDHGCCAHSEAAVAPASPETPSPSYDGDDVEIVRLDGAPEQPAGATAAHPPGSVSDSEPSEPLGHS
jgi:hypothetical protein